MQEFTDEQCREIMEVGRVPEAIAASTPKVAVIFTQSWCADWTAMGRYIDRIEDPDLSVFFVEYDKRSFFTEMKMFKEQTFRNGSIPYVQYFRDGALVSRSNYVVFKRAFLKRFGKQ